jgi:hypothetical protein
MTSRATAAALAAVVVATRLAHAGLLWIEEAYPAAAALRILSGEVPYRDYFFDKPPLSAIAYLLFGARDGVPLRIAGAAFVLLACWIAWRFGDDAWGPTEGLVAAILMGFSLTFWFPAAVIPMAPDLLMIAPHLAAVYLAWSGRPFWSGLLAGIALLANAKGVIVLAAVLLWQARAAPMVLAGFAVPAAIAAAALAALGALGGYWEQVWWWGARYAADSPLDNALGAAVEKTAAWAAFHATIVIAAFWLWRRIPTEDNRRMAMWALLALISVAVGWRFFPRYYFVLLPPLVMAAARGLALMNPRHALLAAALLAIPLVRFGPRYLALATGRDPGWSDAAMFNDSRRAAEVIASRARPGDTLFVWGYRPDVYVLARLRAGTPFLDSQPLTGVLADRHLTSSSPTFPELAAANRRRLAATRPAWIVDGLGPYNERLGIGEFEDLAAWLRDYEVAVTTQFSSIYRRRQE